MYRLKLIATFLLLSLTLLFFLPSVKADEWNKKTQITFSQPVEIPGVGVHMLPAGTYIFKLFDSPSNRHIVQIFNEDETKLLATILAIPNYRLQSTNKTVITFLERTANEPEALRAWFYPGSNFGVEFVYPKSRAIELAKLVRQPVLVMPTELAPVITQPAESVNEETVAILKNAPVKAVNPDGDELEIAPLVEETPEVKTTPPSRVEPSEIALAQKEPVAVERINRLPQTSSQMPLLALIGFLSIGTSITLSAIAKYKAMKA